MRDPIEGAASHLNELWDALLRDEGLYPTSSEADFLRQLIQAARGRAFEPEKEFVQALRQELAAPQKDREAMITGMHHVVLFCTDTERSRDWYDRAGFEYNRGYGGMHWFNAGPYELMLHPAPEGPSGNAPHIHVATSDVEGMFVSVRSAGLTPVDHQQPDVALNGPVTRPWGDREFELEDPDGNRIVITET